MATFSAFMRKPGVDDSTVTITSKKIGIKAGGVGATQLAAGAVVEAKLGAGAVATAKIADDAVTNAKLYENTIQVAEVALSNSEIKGLAAAPKTLVAAPGANKVIEFLGAVLALSAGTDVLTESADNMAIRYTDGAGAIVSEAIESTGFIDQAANTITTSIPKKDVIVATASAANQAIVLDNTGEGEYAGNASNDATMKVFVSYRVHSLA